MRGGGLAQRTSFGALVGGIGNVVKTIREIK